MTDQTHEQELPLHRYQSDKARKLADYVLILADLGFAADCCRRVLAMQDDDPKDGVVEQALWASAVVSYVRCFTSGRRVALDHGDVRELGLDGALEFHIWIDDLRDKHIAHPVNAFEEARVGVVLSHDEDDERVVEGVVALAVTYYVPAMEGVANFLRLIEALGRLAGDRREQVEQEVLDELRGLSLADLEQGPPLGVRIRPPNEAGRPRKG